MPDATDSLSALARHSRRLAAATWAAATLNALAIILLLVLG